MWVKFHHIIYIILNLFDPTFNVNWNWDAKTSVKEVIEHSQLQNNFNWFISATFVYHKPQHFFYCIPSQLFTTRHHISNPLGLPGHLHQRDAREPGCWEQRKLTKRPRSLGPEQPGFHRYKNPKLGFDWKQRKLGKACGAKVGVGVELEEQQQGGGGGEGECQWIEIFDTHRDVRCCRLPLLHISCITTLQHHTSWETFYAVCCSI